MLVTVSIHCTLCVCVFDVFLMFMPVSPCLSLTFLSYTPTQPKPFTSRQAGLNDSVSIVKHSFSTRHHKNTAILSVSLIHRYSLGTTGITIKHCWYLACFCYLLQRQLQLLWLDLRKNIDRNAFFEIHAFTVRWLKMLEGRSMQWKHSVQMKPWSVLCF